MKTFIEFIKEEIILESSWSNLLYHATRNNYDPKKINSMSHFGDIHAALIRSVQFQYKGKGSNNYKIHAYEYNTKGKGKQIEDNFEEVPPHEHAMEIAHQLHNKRIINKKEYSTIEGTNNGYSYNPDQSYFRNKINPNAHHELKNVLLKKGITHLTYKNNSENIGSTSTIVFDPEKLKHVHTFNNPKILNRDSYWKRMEHKGRMLT